MRSPISLSSPGALRRLAAGRLAGKRVGPCLSCRWQDADRSLEGDQHGSKPVRPVLWYRRGCPNMCAKLASLALRVGHMLVLACGLLLAACSGNDETALVEKPAEQLYNEAQDMMEAGDY